MTQPYKARLATSPRDRLLQYGADALSDAELLALVMGVDPLITTELMQTHKSLPAIEQAGIAELCSLKGIGEKRACILKAIMELGRRFQAIPLERGHSFTSSTDIFQAYGPKLKGLEQELFYVLHLNARNQILREQCVAIGSVNKCPVMPQEIFALALREKALRLILIHSHPSGDPEPSSDDRALTRRLVQIANIINMEIIDHLVIGDNRYVSFADRGWI